MNEKQINELVDAKPEVVENEIVVFAKAQRTAEVKARKVAAMTRALDQMAAATKEAVRNLRDARTRERACKENLVKVADAERQFHVDGDVRAYATTIFGAGNRQVEYFVANYRELMDVD